MTDTDQAQLAIPIPPSRQRSAFSEPCPKCGVAPGERYCTASGDVAGYAHSARRRLTIYLPVPR